MGGTVTPDLTEISLCDALTGWSAVGGSNSLNDPDVFGHIQGNYCIQNYNSAAANRGADFTWGTDTDLTGQTIYSWFAFNKKEILQNKGSTGLRIRITDVSGNWGEWDIAGKDTLPHAGWICWAVRTSQTYSRTSGTNPTLTQIRKVGWRADSVSNKGYIYFDAWRYGQGLSVTGGSSGDPATFETFFAEDDLAANKYGVISKLEGAYFVQGVLNVGKADQTSTTYFKDTSKVVIFKDAIVGADFYAINAVGASGYATTFYLGEKSGSSGISGCVLNAAGSAKYAITLTNAYATVVGVYGCTFLNGGTVSLPASAANKEVLNTSFVACAEVLADTCTVENCSFIAAPGYGVRVSSTSHNVKDCTFVGCADGVNISVAGPHTFNGLMFDSNTYDVINTAGVAVEVGKSNGSNPSTYDPAGDTVTFTGSVQLTITVKDEDNLPVVGACAFIDDNDQTPYIMNTTTSDQGIATTGYTGSPVTGARWRVRKYGYKDFKMILDIGGSNIDLPVVLITDPQQV